MGSDLYTRLILLHHRLSDTTTAPVDRFHDTIPDLAADAKIPLMKKARYDEHKTLYSENSYIISTAELHIIEQHIMTANIGSDMSDERERRNTSVENNCRMMS